MNVAVLTIISKNYLAFARTLMQSVERHNSSYRRFVVLTDDVEGCFDPTSEPFTTILSTELPIPQNRWLYFKYSILELNTAVKPYAMEYLAKTYNLSRLIYLDPDIKVYHSLDRLLHQLESSDILLTPHLLDPIDDGFVPAELDILRAGAYNLGFIAVRTNYNSLRFLSWWQNKVLDHCYVDFKQGLFTDQRWMDLAPGMFRNVGIVREPGYNLAYWNIKTRPIERAPGGEFTVAGGPMYFFHFSGLNLSSPDGLSKHQNRFKLEDLSVVRELVHEYVQDVLANGYTQSQQWPYTYSSFQNGVAIPDFLRRLATESPDLMDRMQNNPFSREAFREYVNYWNCFVPDPSGNRSFLTRLALVIYNKRLDLQSHAPEVFGRDLLWFLDWFVHNVQREYGLDETFVAPLAEHRNRLMREAPAGTAISPSPAIAPRRPRTR